MATRRFRPLAIALAALLATVGVPIAFSNVPLGRPAASGDVPDTVLAVKWPAQQRSPLATFTRRQVSVVEPAGGAMRILLEGAQQPVVSSDGRELYFLQYRDVGDAVCTDVLALASESLLPLWRTSVASTPLRDAAQSPNPPVGHYLAATRDRVYVASYRVQLAGPVEILVLDRVDGLERARWSIDIGQAVGGLSLVPTPDGARMYLLAFGSGSFGSNTAPPLTLIQLRLRDGREEARHTQVQAPDAGYFTFGRLTPDGRAIYRVTPDHRRPMVSVGFLDSTTASLERVEVNFTSPGDMEFASAEWGVSPDGWRLYVLWPMSGELAVVDLAERRVVQTVALRVPGPRADDRPVVHRIWASLGGLLAPEVSAKLPFSDRLQVSPDGHWLYAIGARAERNAIRGDGVLAIDTTRWQVVHHWLTGSQPWLVLMNNDGRHLYVQEQAAQGSVLHVLDTATGAEVATSAPLESHQLFTLAELYRDRYGRSPLAVDLSGQANTAGAPIATLAVSASPRTLLAGNLVTLEVLFVDPASGQALEPHQVEVRFDPPTQVTAVLSRGRGSDDGQIVTLDPVSFASYRGTATVSAPDSWSDGTLSMRVVAQWEDGSRRQVFMPDAVTVQPAFVGSDGQRYVLHMVTEPSPPVAEQPAAVRLAFASADTGERLTDEVALVDGLPATVEASFFGGGGVTTSQLAASRRGEYEGLVRLWAPGMWRMTATLVSPTRGTYTVGVLKVAGR